jgi:hypothetical protein
VFVIPTGIMLGAKVNVYDRWVWNQILVTLGGFVFTGLALYVTYESAETVDRCCTSRRANRCRMRARQHHET